jgi:tRNA G10  N-methylase Trm11
VPDVRPIHDSGYDRREGDFYPTPAWVTECLLSNVTLRGRVWEPCCGDGAIAKVLTAAGHEVVASDLADRGFGQGGVDVFKTSQMPDGCRSLVTNPPYGDGGARGRAGKAALQMLAFTEHTVRLARQVAVSLPCWSASNGSRASAPPRC